VCLLSLFYLNSVQAQDIELLYKDDSYRFTNKPEAFEYIDYKMDLSSFYKIAEFKLKIDKHGKKSITNVFYDFWSIANNMGANSFSIEDVTLEDGQYVVFVDLFYLNDENMQYNYSLYEENVIIVFGDLDTKNEDKAKSFKLGKEKVSLLPYTYIKHQNEVGEKIKLSIGGIFGSSVTEVGGEHKLGRCYSLGGTRVMPSGGVAVGTGGSGMGVGIAISTGSIYPMDLNFGLFVMTVLDTVKRDTVEVNASEVE